MSKIVIPDGWRELEEGEVIVEGDMFYFADDPDRPTICKNECKNGMFSPSSCGKKYEKNVHVVHIRKSFSFQISQYTFE